MLNRRGFLAHLFAAPIVALALLKAPVVEVEAAPLAFHPEAFKFVMEPLDIEEMQRRYVEPAMKAMFDRWDESAMEQFGRVPR